MARPPVDPRLWRYARSARNYLVLSVGLSLLTTVAIVAAAVLLGRVLAGVITDPGQRTVAAWHTELVLLAVAVASRALAAWWQARIAHRAGARVVAELEQSVLAAGAGLPPRELETRRTELAVVVSSGLSGLRPYLTGYVPALLLAVLVPPVVLVVIAAHDLTSAVIVLITLPLIPIFMVLIGLLTEGRARATLDATTRLSDQLLDLFAGMPTLRALGRETGTATETRGRTMSRQVRELGESLHRRTMSALRIAFLSSMVLELLATLSVALVAVAIGMRLVHGDMSLYAGVVALVLAPEVYLPLRTVGERFHAAQDGMAAAEKAFAILEPAETGNRSAATARSTVGTQAGTDDSPEPNGLGTRGADPTAQEAGLLQGVSATAGHGEERGSYGAYGGREGGSRDSAENRDRGQVTPGGGHPAVRDGRAPMGGAGDRDAPTGGEGAAAVGDRRPGAESPDIAGSGTTEERAAANTGAQPGSRSRVHGADRAPGSEKPVAASAGASGTAPDGGDNVIEIRDLTVESRDGAAPDGLWAQLRPGAVTALTGPNGSGKSTVLQAILGLIEPTRGAVFADGVDIRQLPAEQWWQRLAWLPQRPVLVPGTLRENLELLGATVSGSPRRGAARVLSELDAACATTGFDTVLESLPAGWDTVVGAGGVGLSLGQRQRLALTRVLAAGRPIVLLDEPTAHLDPDSEAAVAAALTTLARTGVTVVVVAHRHALLAAADEIVTVPSTAQRVAR